MTVQSISWEQDGIDSGWFFAKDVGSVSSSRYHPGGWWFLPKWLPDTEENDVGPFKTKAAAMAQAEALTARQLANQD
ncbi:hypothetical protein [Rhizobium leguminosarum]|uniref:hypothetical protein n=1 Tax=Rhizobium leguminosarum TaxID=384 RepID=UPI00103FEF80|nr:hypothetical protein [Rhizobium leguminosarum]TBZ06330.1 hypothetical protein E0H38_32795 [Rhizobium leguminosarum bv. viciae]TBZ68921.1 hypothetical protein E0H43_24235 [Rhizobium leguminosarum bv. viciae]